MDPNIWGPKAWFFIHNIALTYTPKDRDKFKIFFSTLGDVLPCTVCRNHYKENLVNAELEKGLNSNIDLFRWTVDMHNKVNKLQNKRVISYEEALQSMNSEYHSSNEYLVFIIIGLILFVLYFNKKYFH